MVAIPHRHKSAGAAWRSWRPTRGGQSARWPSDGNRRRSRRRLTSTSNAWHDYSRSAAAREDNIRFAGRSPKPPAGSLFAVPVPTRVRGATNIDLSASDISIKVPVPTRARGATIEQATKCRLFKTPPPRPARLAAQSSALLLPDVVDGWLPFRIAIPICAIIMICGTFIA